MVLNSRIVGFVAITLAAALGGVVGGNASNQTEWVAILFTALALLAIVLGAAVAMRVLRRERELHESGEPTLSFTAVSVHARVLADVIVGSAITGIVFLILGLDINAGWIAFGIAVMAICDLTVRLALLRRKHHKLSDDVSINSGPIDDD
jgi:ABC-type nickel/cobalt efflux system permease component RcnA